MVGHTTPYQSLYDGCDEFLVGYSREGVTNEIEQFISYTYDRCRLWGFDRISIWLDWHASPGSLCLLVLPLNLWSRSALWSYNYRKAMGFAGIDSKLRYLHFL